MHDLVFLTRDGCVNTTTMRARLDAALSSLGLPTDYQFIDADALPTTDARAGYGTPTVLYRGRDLFGLAEPPVPHSAADLTAVPGRSSVHGCDCEGAQIDDEMMVLHFNV